jgi:hypothetical protein
MVTEKKILVSIANYCDPEFYNTVKILWDKAKQKESLIFSLVSEDHYKYDFSFIPKDQIIYRHFDPKVYRGGLCWARKLATDIEIDYDFIIQFDSHTYALESWDTKTLEYYKLIQKLSSKYIIAYAPPDYEVLPSGKINLDVLPQTSRTAENYKDLVPGFLFPKYRELVIGEIVQTYWPTCAFLFAPKKWVDEVGFSEISAFNTEEIDLAINTFNKKWSIYSVGARDVFHNTSHRQSNGSYTRFEHRPWADERKEQYWDHVKKATEYTARLLSGKEHVSINTLKKFFEFTGLNKKYLDYDKEYYYHIKVSSPPFDHVAMPPRKDIFSYKNQLQEHPMI